jgi:hypothetical protein
VFDDRAPLKDDLSMESGFGVGHRGAFDVKTEFGPNRALSRESAITTSVKRNTTSSSFGLLSSNTTCLTINYAYEV